MREKNCCKKTEFDLTYTKRWNFSSEPGTKQTNENIPDSNKSGLFAMFSAQDLLWLPKQLAAAI